jgi:tetratricopeptide (TPR) repeat protein
MNVALILFLAIQSLPPAVVATLTAPPLPPDELFSEGMADLESSDPEAVDRALVLLEQAAAAAPDNLRYGAEYRQAAIATEAFDRSIAFFESLAAIHPESADVRLNWGYAYVDKIPAAGAVTQVILANTALSHFTEAIERDPTWLALYTRGNSYVYWPAIFGRAKLGVADLERAVEMSEEHEPRRYYAHAYAALGDGWWRLGDLDRAREVWRRGVERLAPVGPLPALDERLALDDRALDAYLKDHYAIGQRVETDLRELWEEGAEP